MIEAPFQTYCPCGKPTIQNSGQKKQYCSDACKQAAYRKRKAEISNDVEQRIAKLEDQVHALQTQLSFETQLQRDTAVRHFKTWLRRRPQPRDSDFIKRFIADSRLPQHASRALYEAKLRIYGYSAEDIYLFRDLWLTLMLEQS